MARLKGMRVDQLHDNGELSVAVALSTRDQDAIRQNDGKSAPMMLREVVSEGEDGDYFGNAVIVDAGSVIEFTITSKGPVGYGYRIKTDHEAIVDRLYCCDPQKAGQALTDKVWRYQATSALIRVDDPALLANKTGAGELAKRWACRITSWNVHGYLHPDSNYYGKSRGETVIDARPGVVSQWGSSGQQFTQIDQINEDDPDTRTNGYLFLYFFVFDGPEARARLVQTYRQPSFA